MISFTTRLKQGTAFFNSKGMRLNW